MGLWTLRTRLTVLLAATMSITSLLSSVTYLTSSRAEDRLEAAFAEELAVMSELPEHRGRLRQVDLMTDNYLLTRDTRWLSRRRDAIALFEESHARLGRLIHEPAEVRFWNTVMPMFRRYVAGQDGLLARAQAGTLTRAQALATTLLNNEVDALIKEMSRFGQLGFAEIDMHRRAARAAALATFFLVLAFGLSGSILVAAAVSRIILTPLAKLRAEAARWRLGEPWLLTLGQGAPELTALQDSLRTMTEKLNEQYEREREAGRLKSQLVSGVSHEFNNALTVIHTAHSLLLEDAPASAEAAEWHEMMTANIRALSGMATNLLNLGRLESGKFSLEARRVEILPILRSCFERLGMLGRRKKQDLRLEISKDLPPVTADPDALPLVVANLLTNAFKYTPEGGAVTLGARLTPDGNVEVFVQDTGIGIAPEEREKIFGGYYRTEAGKRAAKGFGVGLTLARMILEAHETTLALESAPGKGSRFSFRLPPHDPGRATGFVG